MPEIMLYVRCITVRKMIEAGMEEDLPTDPNLLSLLETITEAKKRRAEKWNQNG